MRYLILLAALIPAACDSTSVNPVVSDTLTYRIAFENEVSVERGLFKWVPAEYSDLDGEWAEFQGSTWELSLPWFEGPKGFWTELNVPVGTTFQILRNDNVVEETEFPQFNETVNRGVITGDGVYAGHLMMGPSDPPYPQATPWVGFEVLVNGEPEDLTYDDKGNINHVDELRFFKGEQHIQLSKEEGEGALRFGVFHRGEVLQLFGYLGPEAISVEMTLKP